MERKRAPASLMRFTIENRSEDRASESIQLRDYHHITGLQALSIRASSLRSDFTPLTFS